MSRRKKVTLSNRAVKELANFDSFNDDVIQMFVVLKKNGYQFTQCMRSGNRVALPMWGLGKGGLCISDVLLDRALKENNPLLLEFFTGEIGLKPKSVVDRQFTWTSLLTNSQVAPNNSEGTETIDISNSLETCRQCHSAIQHREHSNKCNAAFCSGFCRSMHSKVQCFLNRLNSS